MCISKKAELDTAISDAEVEFTSGIYQEKQILIDALEKWLRSWNREFGYFDRQAAKMRIR
jgi:hypothetical protein